MTPMGLLGYRTGQILPQVWRGGAPGLVNDFS